MNYSTSSLCHVCFRQVPGVIAARDDGSLWMSKTCKDHGTIDVMVERDRDFCLAASAQFGFEFINPPITLVEITNRCNNRCPNCYHSGQRHMAEPSVEEILGRVAGIANQFICLIGGEPTVRSDLPEIIKAIRRMGRHVSMYTNGIRFAEPEYCEVLAEAGLQEVAFSLHHPEYSHATIFKKKLLALENLGASPIQVDHVAFSLQHETQIPTILDLIEQHDSKAKSFRIRSAYQPESVPWFVSDLCKMVKAEAERRGKRFEFFPGANNTRYQVGFWYEATPLWLMSWPSNLAIDFAHASGYPQTSFMDGFEAHFCRSICIRDGLTKGWFGGRKLSNMIA